MAEYNTGIEYQEARTSDIGEAPMNLCSGKVGMSV